MTFLLGAHQSVAGGLYKAFERGDELGCETMQIFSKNQQQWATKPLSATDVEMFSKAREESPIKRFFIHDSYLINLGSPEDEKWQKSIAAFKDELDRANRLGAEALVFHPGAHLKQMTDEECCDKVAEALNIVFEDYDGQTVAVIENTAGQGSNIGWAFEHSALIIEGVEKKQHIGTCFDTCHAFAAGYDLSTEEGYEAVWEDYEEVIGLDYLKCLHINDSKTELASRKDRHENLGLGHIGELCFEMLAQDERFDGKLGALETPMETNDGHERDLKLLMNWRG